MEHSQAPECSLNSILLPLPAPEQPDGCTTALISAGHFSHALKLQLRFLVSTLDGTVYRIKFRKFIWATARGAGAS